MTLWPRASTAKVLRDKYDDHLSKSHIRDGVDLGYCNRLSSPRLLEAKNPRGESSAQSANVERKMDVIAIEFLSLQSESVRKMTARSQTHCVHDCAPTK